MKADWQWEEATVAEVTRLFSSRLAKGRALYGRLDPANKSRDAWLREMLEEAVDLTVYALMALQHAKQVPGEAGGVPGTTEGTPAEGTTSEGGPVPSPTEDGWQVDSLQRGPAVREPHGNAKENHGGSCRGVRCSGGALRYRVAGWVGKALCTYAGRTRASCTCKRTS